MYIKSEFLMEMYGLILTDSKDLASKQDNGSLIFDGQSVRESLFKNLDTICNQVFYSLRVEQMLEPKLRSLKSNLVLLNQLDNTNPAFAILTAYQKNPKVNWLLVACDFYLATAESFLNLAEHFSVANAENEVACYTHVDGTPEPFFSIWRPQALQKLQQAVINKVVDPMKILTESNPYLIKPYNQDWLKKTNNFDVVEKIKRLQ